MKKILLALPVVIIAFSSPIEPPVKGTNVIITFMDDMAYGDLSSYGALDYRSPNLDKMAVEGMRFTNFLSAQAVCNASRAALLTGCYPNRIGISGALFPGAPTALAQEETTIAEMLKQKKLCNGNLWKMAFRGS